MSDKTKIAWCSATWNIFYGCSAVSPGCANCYAALQCSLHGHGGNVMDGVAERIPNGGARWLKLADGSPAIFNYPARLEIPLRWKKPRLIFVNSLSDTFHEAVPDSVIDKIIATIAVTPRHNYIIPTKRVGRAREYFSKLPLRQELIGIDAERISGLDRHVGQNMRPRWPLPLPNLCLLASVENQEFADLRIPELLQIPAAFHGISLEPMLGPVNLRYDFLPRMESLCNTLDWVIIGGESGPNARPCNIEWIRDVVRQCQLARVPVFVKQLGGSPDKRDDPAAWPDDLRIQEYPDSLGIGALRSS